MARHDIPAAEAGQHLAVPGCCCRPVCAVGDRGDDTSGVLYVHHEIGAGARPEEEPDHAAPRP